MIRSFLRSDRVAGLRGELYAAVVAGLVVLTFGMSQAAIWWGREVAFQPFDIVRAASAAGLGGALPAALAAFLGARLRKLDHERKLARLLFWSAPLAAVAISVVATFNADPPWWMLPMSIGLLGLLGWRGRLFWRAPAGITPTAWIIVAAGFVFSALHWGPPVADSKGALAFALIGSFLALVVCLLGATQLAMRRLARPATVCAGLVLLACMTTAWLPWVLIDGYLKAKLIVVAALAFGTAHLAATTVVAARKPMPRALSFGAVGVLAGMLLAGMLLASAWMASLPVPDRFGSLERDSIVGLVWTLASAPHDADSDGYYAVEAGGNDPDDTRASVGPPATLEATSDKPGRVAPPDAPPPTFEQPVEHVIIIVVDSLRADLLADANKRAQFEFLDKLDAESARFERAYSPGNRTRISLGPMLTGLAPEVFASLSDSPERYGRTLDKNWVGRLASKHFASHGQGERGRSALIFSTPFAWMQDGEFDVEADYHVVDPAADAQGHTSARFASHFDAIIDGGFFDGPPTVTVGYLADPHAEHVCDDGSRGGYDCYIDEIQLVDRTLEHIYGRLEGAGLLDQTLLIVTADHGRAFGELNYNGHATTLDEETIRVALLMRLPDGTPRRISAPVSLTALPATAADALHVDPVTPQLDASLLGHLDDDADAPDEPVSVDNHRGSWGLFPVHRTAFIEGDRKLTYDWHTTHHTLVDLDEELEAGSDLSRQEPKRAKKMIERLFNRREEALEIGRQSLAQ